MKKIFIPLLLSVLVLSFSCTNKQQKIKDTVNRKIVVPAKVEKVICLSPGLLQWINNFELQDKVVGVGRECSEVQHNDNIPVVGSYFGFDTNAVKQIKPDVVIALTTLNYHLREWLEKNNICVALFKYPTKIEDMYDGVKLLGQIFDKNSEAEKTVSKYKKAIEALGGKDAKNKPTAYFSTRFNDPLGEDGIANRNHIMGNFLELAGYNNIAANNDDGVMERDDIVKSNVDYIFIDSMKKDAFAHTSPYATLSAVQEGRLIAVNEKSYRAYSPDYIEIIRSMALARQR